MKKRTVLITGASRGIGKSIKDLLKKEQYTVYAPTRQELDLLSDDSIRTYVKKNSQLGIDIIINNAGINFPQWIEEMSDENIKDTVQVNLIAPIKLIRGFSGWMIKNKWGRIINISSAYGIVARGKQVLYSTTKHGLNGMTKALALEFAKHNILVNSVCPGFTETELLLRNSKAKRKQLVADIPLGRFGKTTEIAKLVSFLISEDNSYMTGSVVVIDGGFVSH